MSLALRRDHRARAEQSHHRYTIGFAAIAAGVSSPPGLYRGIWRFRVAADLVGLLRARRLSS